MFDAVRAQYGQLDVLVNNAGIMLSKPFAEAGIDVLRRQLRINVESVYMGMHGALPLLREAVARGAATASVVNIASIYGKVGGEQYAAYSATKGAVRALTKAVAMELASSKIRVNAVLPGPVLTNLSASWDPPIGRAWQAAQRRAGAGRLGAADPDGAAGRDQRHRAAGRLPRQRSRELHHRLGIHRRWRLYRRLNRQDKPMQITAAVVPERGAAFAIAALEIEQPRAGEVLVEIAGVGLCHTDLVFRDAFIPIPWPIVLGHEGAGIVRAVGAGVASVQPGDAVVIGFSSCGHCSRCDQHLPSYCREFVPLNYAGARGDGSTALSLDGQPVASHFFGQSSFASHAITLERNVVKVDAEGLELSRLGPLACGLQTGAGSVMRSFDCRKGSTIAIFGGGPVGLAAVMAAALRKLRADHPDRTDRSAARARAGIRGQRRHRSGETAMSPQRSARFCRTAWTMRLRPADARRSWKRRWVAGQPRRARAGRRASSAESTLSINIAGMITFGHRIIGIVEGDSDLQTFIPELIALHRAGKFPFDRLIKTFPLARSTRPSPPSIAANASRRC